jgi:hypothetical protein
MWYDPSHPVGTRATSIVDQPPEIDEALDGTSRGSTGTLDPREAAEHLLASSTLVDVLAVIFSEPNQSLYVNELIRRTGRFPRSVQLALAKLEVAGVVQSQRRANVRYYRLVLDHPFYPELSSICTKLGDVAFPIRRAISSLKGLRVAFLRPDEAGSSDVNVVVVGEDDLRGPAEAALSALSTRLRRAIRVEFVSVEEWARQARRERSFVRWLLEEKRRYLVGSDFDLPGR